MIPHRPRGFSDRDLDAKALGNVIRRLREKRNMTQEEAALAGNICQSYLSHVENGNHSLSVHKLFSLTRALKIPEVEVASAFTEEYEKLCLEQDKKNPR
jgi:transcriptional regulator with XRE-family HTH domain